MGIGFNKWIMGCCFISLAAFTSCLDAEESEFDKLLKEEDQQITKYLQDNHQEAERTGSGIYYTILKANTTGKALKANDVVSIRYKLSTLSDQLIDSASVTSEGKPIRFQYTNGGILPQGINRGVSLMKEGEAYRFYIPSVYGYSDFKYKSLIPANAILIADVEITKLETKQEISTQEKAAIQQYIAGHQLENVIEHDSGFFYQTIQAGSGDQPRNGQVVEVAYKGMYLNDQVFDQSEEGKPLTFVIGAGNIIPGFDLGIKQMKKGEKGKLFIPSRLAFGSGVQVIPEEIRKDYLESLGLRDWKPFEPIIFEVELQSIK